MHFTWKKGLQARLLLGHEAGNEPLERIILTRLRIEHRPPYFP